MERRQEIQAKEQESKACLKIAIIVLNWNGWTDTLKCLESIFHSNYPNYMVVVCDNGSEDDSVNRIGDWADGRLNAAVSKSDPLARLLVPPVPKPISYKQLKRSQAEDESTTVDENTSLVLIQNGSNLGFAKGNNVGIRYALRCEADYIFVLNNDTVVHPLCINDLIKFGEEQPHAALIGPKVLDRDLVSHRQWAVAKRLDFASLLLSQSPFRRLVHKTSIFQQLFYFGDVPACVYAIHGCAMMFKASTLYQIELFDERTFLYWEEFIIAEKLRKHSLQTFVVPSTVIWHIEGSSTAQMGAKKFIEYIRSERVFVEKYLALSYWQRIIVAGVRLCTYICKMLVDKSYRRNFGGFIQALFGA